MNYWLVKTEPEAFGWEDMEKDGKAIWDGVRNYAARNNLKAMQLGDLVLFYHSITGKEIVGYTKVIKEHYPDPTAEKADTWVVVELEPVEKFPKTVTLAQIKADERLQNMVFVKIGRLSVSPVSKEEFDAVLELAYS